MDRNGAGVCSGRRLSVSCLGLLAVVSLFILGCGGGGAANGGGGGGTSQTSITSITVACSPSSIVTTQTAACTATVAGTGTYSSAVNWSVGPAGAGTISSQGVFTPSTAGSSSVKATSVQDPSKSATSTISVSNPTILSVNITDLPTGTPANVTITDPNGSSKTISASQNLNALPGTYTIAASPAEVGSNTYYATQAVQTVTVSSQATTTVNIDYFDIVPKTTKVLDAAGQQSLTVSPDATTITISSASSTAQTLQAGDVLTSVPTSSAPNGLLVDILSVNTSGSTMTAIVQRSTLVKAIQRGSLTYTQTLGPSNTQVVNLLPGSRILTPDQVQRSKQILSPNSLANSCSNNSNTFIQPFSYTLGGAQSGISQSSGGQSSGLSFSDEVHLDGTLQLCPQLQVSVKWGFLSVQSARVVATFGEHTSITMKGESRTSFDATRDFLSFKTVPQWVMVGSIPVVVQGKATVYGGAKFSAQAGFYDNAEQDAQAQAGLDYESGSTTPVQSVTFDTANNGASLDGALQGKFFVGLRLGLLLYDSIFPNIAVDTYIKGSGSPVQTVDWGLEANVGVEASILDTNLKVSLASPELVMFEVPIWQQPGLAATVESVLPNASNAGSPNAAVTIHGTNFVPSSIVDFNGLPISTTFSSPTSLTAMVPASSLVFPGTFPITVSNPDTAGTASNSVTFSVNGSGPSIAISPSSVTIPVGGIQTFSVAPPGGGASLWSVQEGTSGGSVTSSGLYSAPVQPGTYHVVVTSAVDSTQSAVAIVNVVSGPTLTTLHAFDHASEGAIPWSAPIVASDGNLYGVTEGGGDLSCGYLSSIQGCGTIYKSDLLGNISTLHRFNGVDGAYPVGSLSEPSPGLFFGTTDFGGANTSQCVVVGTSIFSGCGSIFKLAPQAGFSSIFSFGPFYSPLGAGPIGALTTNLDGTLYGATQVGGNASCTGYLGTQAESGCGSLFSVSSTDSVSAIHTFAGPEGAYPAYPPRQNADGNSYGVTPGGGSSSCTAYTSPGCGTFYEMSGSGSISTLHAFNANDGSYPSHPVLGFNGNFYGVTIFGGSAVCSGGAKWQGCGTVYQIDTAGHFSVLHSFSGPDGAYPTALTQAPDGYLYGTTQGGGDLSCSGRYGPGCGTVFRIDSAGNLTLLYSFTGQSDGSWPESGLLVGPDGNLYGTTAYGGLYDDGTLFRIDNLGVLAAAVKTVAPLWTEKKQIEHLLRRNPHQAIDLPAIVPPR